MNITAEESIRNKAFPVGISDEDWANFKHSHQGKQWVGFAIKAAEEYANKYHLQKLSEMDAELPSDLDNAWPTKDVLSRLIFAAEYLLNEKSYDGHGYEEVQICVQRGKEILKKLNSDEIDVFPSEDKIALHGEVLLKQKSTKELFEIQTTHESYCFHEGFKACGKWIRSVLKK